MQKQLHSPPGEIVPAGFTPDVWLNEGELERRIAAIEQRYKAIARIREKLMKEGIHYGRIGLTGDPKKDKDKKPSLHQPGAQMLCAVFQLTPNIVEIENIQTWHAEEPFLYYRFETTVTNMSGRVVGMGQGSCNSKEPKYRYRGGGRVCPECDVSAIRRSSFGWYCYEKHGGCGAKFAAEDISITGQEVKRQLNPDIPESANAILKIAYKRSFVAGVLMATMASEFFTQDLEDFDPEDDHGDDPASGGRNVSGSGNGQNKQQRRSPSRPPQEQQQTQPQQGNGGGGKLITEARAKRFWAIAKQSGHSNDSILALLESYGFGRAEDITTDVYDEICAAAAQPPQQAFDQRPPEPSQQQNSGPRPIGTTPRRPTPPPGLWGGGEGR